MRAPGDTIVSVPPRWLPALAVTPAHSRLPATVNEVGAPVTATLVTTRSRAGSIREIVPAYCSATHTDPPAVVSAVGPLATGIVAVTASAAGSILETVASLLLATHSAPSSNTSAAGPSPT